MKTQNLRLSIISAFLIAINCLCFAEAKANPASDFRYTIKDNEITITGYIGKSETVVIPELIEGYPVTVIGKLAFSNNEVVKRVTIPSSVSTVEEKAFYECKTLTEAYISLAPMASIKGRRYDERNIDYDEYGRSHYRYESHDDGAFSGCSSLKTVVIESGLCLDLDTGVFYNCEKLETIVLPKNICISEPLKYPEIRNYNYWLFNKCNNLKIINYRGDKDDNALLFPEENEDFQKAVNDGLVINYNFIE